MEPEQHHPELHIFTLRLWHEELGQGQAEWRGRVQDVSNGETLFFRDWPGLVTTVQRLVETSGMPSTGERAAPQP